MSGCLRDRVLLLLYYGGGNSSQRTHLTECEACAARYRQVGRDLEAISQVLREKPLPKTVSHRFRPFSVRWLPTGAALASGSRAGVGRCADVESNSPASS